MPAKIAKSYQYNLVRPGAFVEFYFPKRVAYQSAIIQALERGVSEKRVEKYLSDYADELSGELAAYPAVLDPERYTGKRTQVITPADVRKRVKMYKNHFFGWSTYSVEGAFLNTYVEPPVLQDELVQVVRVIFQFDSQLDVAKEKGFQGIVQSITSWLLANYRLAFPVLNESQRDRFIADHSPLTEAELPFVQNHYMAIAAEVLKWFDDCVLFTFGYLARRFWKRVADAGRREDEIWITSFFSIGVNILQPGKESENVVS